MAVPTDRGVPVSTLSPKFLHTNSTSHTRPFSAIAELIDNAYDPDVSAKQFWIDKTVVKGEQCLSFMDNGNGLDLETMHKMLSFGYSDKPVMNGVEPIGIYGNGFKSGSMRLGKDAIVFSKSRSTSCVGMLSQTYLEKIGAEQIVVPIVCFEERETKKFSVREEHKLSLQAILRYSPFKTEEELLTEIDVISSSWSTEKTGTRIIIWSLRRTSTKPTEFDFEKDRYDIKMPSEIYETMNDPSQQPDGVNSHIAESVYSLRAYCSILYLKPRMQIVIRGQKVKSLLIAKSLACIRKDHYKPIFLNKRIPITFGYNPKSKDQYGIMMYHKNRLIKPYERVGCQLKANNKGVGVIGVIECNFLDPTHNKQSFNETDKYRKTINSLGVKLEEYWQEIRYRKSRENPNSTVPVEDTMKRPDQSWVQCDGCLQWRKLPDGIDCSKLPDKWYCSSNPDPQFRSCQEEEEPEDSDDDQPSYRKTYKQQEREDKKEQEKRQKEDQRRQEQQRLTNKRQQLENLKQRVHQTTVHPPSTPTTPRSRTLQGGAARAESSALRSSTISQAACSPSSNNGLPVISNVCSLATAPVREKRSHPVTPQTTPKRPRVNGFNRSASDTPSSVDVSSLCSPSLPIVSDDVDDDDDTTDDDLVILETASTPKPQKPVSNLKKVKIEEEQSDIHVSMVLECSDDAAVDDTSDANAAGTGSAESAAGETSHSPAPPQQVTSTTTQTEAHQVKKEVGDRSQTDREARATQSICDKGGKEQHVGSVEQREFKQENSGDTQNRGPQTLQNGGAHCLESDEQAGPSCADIRNYSSAPYPSITEVQEQQDQLLELMEDTAQERDSLKEQVHKLTVQLQEAQSKLQELPQDNIKKECQHQACQTEETGRKKDYKSLFEKAKQKINELIKDKRNFMAATEARANVSTAQDEEHDIDEIALQVDHLVRELDERNKERNELRLQLESLEEENGNLAAQCVTLRLGLQKENTPTPQRGRDSTNRTRRAEAGGSAESSTHSSSDTSRSLIELRHNIGRLLISYVPALDLEQVNYECNVIDEILEQVLTNEGTVEDFRLTDSGGNV
ncbi:MORC family CW-type zinc finger protein 3a [Brachyistius frenatus]|uniref:MORC family CW-type zinc finger protein 3a n=1 Tax=Brachyistius frenatus TaxID=100188 RepID=UPI0037E82538